MQTLKFILTGFLTTQVYAAQVFSGESHWYQTNLFNELEVIGAQFQSIENALASCHGAGMGYCQYSMTAPGGVYNLNGLRHIRFKSVVQAVKETRMTEFASVTTMKDSGFVSNSVPLSTLTNEGAKQIAFTRTMSKCLLSGCDYCIPKSTTFLENNNFREGAYWTTAETIVDCQREIAAGN